MTGFIIINSIPNIVTAVLVFRAMIIFSPSPALMVILVGVTLLPGIIQITGELVALRYTRGRETQVELGDVPTSSRSGVTASER